MTKEQFEHLKIGDDVLNAKKDARVKVTDICRRRGLLCTGGTWRKRSDVEMPEGWENSNLTKLPPVRKYTFPVAMLAEMGLIQSAIIVTLQRCSGCCFVGSLTSLRLALQLDIPNATFFAAYKKLHKEGYISMERLGAWGSRYSLNEEKIKHLL